MESQSFSNSPTLSNKFENEALAAQVAVSSQNENKDQTSGEPKNVSIDYFVIFVAIRLAHSFLFYLKYFVELLTSQKSFDKNQILWLFPYLSEITTVKEMNQTEFKYFIVGYVNKLEREILLNQKIAQSYRSFIDDVIYNFEWRSQEKKTDFDENHLFKRYNFKSDLHYLTDIVARLHLPIARTKFESGFDATVRLFDSYTESPHLNKNGACDLILRSLQYIQGEVQSFFLKGFQFFAGMTKSF